MRHYPDTSVPNASQPANLPQGAIAESVLRRSETLLKLFVHHAPAAIAMFDRDMRYIVASQRFLDDYRIGGDIVGRTHYEVFPEIPERWRLLHQRALAGEVLRAQEDPFPRADGRLDWVRWEIRPWHGEDGQIGGIMLFTEDITERKRAEEALRESEERFRAIANHTADWESWFDWQGKLAWVSPSVERFTGYTPEELLALPGIIPGLLCDQGKAELSLALQDGAEGERGGEFECRCARKDGTWSWLSVTWVPIRDASGKPLGVRTSARDIKARRSAEEQIRCLSAAF
jgi:PAS domain S-box-containing protein